MDDSREPEEGDTTVTWLIRDRDDGRYLTKSGTWHAYSKAGSWATAEDATRALLGVEADRFATVELIEEIRSRRPAMKAADALPSPSSIASIPSSWIAATGTMNPRHLLNTMRLVQARVVDPKDIAAVLEIYEQVTGRRSPVGPRP